MLEIKQFEHRTCDVCGETHTIEYPIEKSNFDWISIGIGYGPDGYYRLDICPSCKKEILNYLKENCDGNATWPKDL